MNPDLARLLKYTKRNEVTGCLEWTGSLTEKGYGRLNHKRAHRLMWEAVKGPIPAGMNVLHRCDNRPCVCIDHLFLGTNGDNNSDRSRKGRSHRPVGERKYPRDVIDAVRASRAPGRELSRVTGMSEAYISEIRSQKYRTQA